MHTAGSHGLRLRKVHIIKPCHYHKVNHVINCLHLRMREGCSRWHTMSSTCEAFQPLSCTPFCFSFAITHHSSYFFFTALLLCIAICLFLSQPLSLTAWFLLFFFTKPVIYSHLPSLHALAPSLWHFILIQTRSFSVLLVCHPPLLLSSLMSPFSQSLSNHFVLYRSSLRNLIDNSRAAPWLLPKKSSENEMVFQKTVCVQHTTLSLAHTHTLKRNEDNGVEQWRFTWNFYYYSCSRFQ